MTIDGFCDGVRGGEYGDLQLLIPELGLVRFDLIVELIGLVVELKLLLPQVQNQNGKENRGEET
jgi:hypothetical protein